MLNSDGSGTFSAWDGIGGTFADEDLGAFVHDRGAVSMANTGPDTNSARWRAGGGGLALMAQPFGGVGGLHSCTVYAAGASKHAPTCSPSDPQAASSSWR